MQEGCILYRFRIFSRIAFMLRQGTKKFDASVLIVAKIIRNLCRKMYILRLAFALEKNASAAHRMNGEGCV